jgi:cell division transport system permease protein
MFNKLKKVISYGYNLLLQEKLISLINIGLTILIVFLIWLTFFSFYFFNQVISYLQERLDFSIYFKPNVSRDDILKIQKILQNFPEVNQVEFVPREIALEKFRKEIQGNPIIAKAIQELKTNPLVDYLIVKADNSEVYLKIADYLEKSPYKAQIDYLTYFENAKVIKRIINFSNQIRFLIVIVVIIILIFASLILFNSSLVSIYSQREEIEILRIIGAGNWFIRGPFFVYTFLTSLIGYILALSIIIIFLMRTESFWPTLLYNFQPSDFVAEKFLILNGISFGIILIINFISTFIAMERYLKT